MQRYKTVSLQQQNMTEEQSEYDAIELCQLGLDVTMMAKSHTRHKKKKRGEDKDFDSVRSD